MTYKGVNKMSNVWWQKDNKLVCYFCAEEFAKIILRIWRKETDMRYPENEKWFFSCEKCFYKKIIKYQKNQDVIFNFVLNNESKQKIILLCEDHSKCNNEAKYIYNYHEIGINGLYSHLICEQCLDKIDYDYDYKSVYIYNLSNFERNESKEKFIDTSDEMEKFFNDLQAEEAIIDALYEQTPKL